MGLSRGLQRCFPAIFLLAAAWAQSPTKPESNSELNHLLSQMDRTAANFRTTQADFIWDQYQKVVDETDEQKGMVYFRRVSNETQMAADITEPAPQKYLLFTDSKIQVYQVRIDQVTTYNAGKDRASFESFLVLGFGGSGQEMLKSFDVKYLGSEKVGDLETAKLELVPKSEKVRNVFNRIWLWIDPSRGVSVQQQLFAPDGDYRLAKYSEIQLNQKIPDGVFKLKTTSKTKFVSPQG